MSTIGFSLDRIRIGKQTSLLDRTLYLTPCPFQDASKWVDRDVFTPNPRAARALGVPSRSLESLARHVLSGGGLAVAPALTAHRLLRRAVQEALCSPDAEGTARVVAGSVRELLRAGVDEKQLSRLTSARGKPLAQVTDAYRTLLRQLRLVDAAEALWEAARLEPERQSVLVYGYARLGAGECAFLDAVAGDGSELLLPYASHPLFVDTEETAQLLQTRGWRVDTCARRPVTIGEELALGLLQDPASPPEAQAHVYPHLEAEVRGTLSQIKALLADGTAPDEIALVARDDSSYGPPVLAVAWEYGVPIRALYAIPLAETRIGTWVKLLLDSIQESFPFETTARLLSHPFGPGLTDPQWSESRRRHPSGMEAWQQAGIDLSALAWPHRSTRGDYARRFHCIADSAALRQRAGSWAREVIAFHTLQEGMAEFSQPHDEPIAREEFVSELLGALSLLTVLAHPGRGGVELHTPLSLFGARYRHVFVLGAAEGVLPASVRDDMVIDFHERRGLAQQGVRLEGAAESARRETLSFWMLLQSATKTITLSYPRLMETRELLPSPYLGRLSLTPSAPPGLPVASPEEARSIALRRNGWEDLVLPYARHAWAVERRREGSDPHDEYDGVVSLPLDLRDRVFSASQLTALGQCPFKWFAGYVLRLAEPEEAEDDLGPGLKGQLCHRALKRGMSGGARNARQALLDRLEEAFLEAEQDLEIPPLPAWEARRAELLSQLRLAVEAPEFVSDGAEVLALEREFQTRWSGLQIRGVIDRVDRTPEGLLLVDYKTGSQPPPGVKNAEGKARLDIQLPLYQQAAAPALFPGEPVLGAHYFSLAKGVAMKAPVDEAVLEDLVTQVKQRLAAGNYPVAPDVDQQACAYCPFDLVCRRGPRLRRKGTNQ
jgi:hypothetical protein